MTLLKAVSFDIADDVAGMNKYDANIHTSAYNSLQTTDSRRTGAKYFRNTSSSGSYLRISAGDTISEGVIGFAFKRYDNTGAFLRVTLENGSQDTIIFEFGANGLLRGYMLSSSSNYFYEIGDFNLDVWNYFEIKFKIDNSTGYVVVKINGKEVANETGLDTLYSSFTEINNILFNTCEFCIMDFYCCDLNGTVNNDFLGDIRVDALDPDGDGNSSDFTPSAGNNYECVDENDMDDTEYVSSDTATDLDLYTYDNLVGTSESIFALIQNLCVRKDDAGSRLVTPTLRVNASNYEHADDIAPGTDYAGYYRIYELNPDDSAAWADADVNAVEAGIELDT